MDTRVAVISVIAENKSNTEEINRILHEYSDYIIGRMGIPYPKRGIYLISIAVDAPQNTISGLSGRLGMIEGVSAKTAYSKNPASQCVTEGQ